MRDRLIELIKSKSCQFYECPDNGCEECDHIELYNDDIENMADFILADGWIRPPCKVGDEVYRIVEMSTGITSKIRAIRKEAKTTGIIQPCEPTIKRFIRGVTVTKNNIIDCCENYGKTVFLTREEAEQALKGGVQE